MNDTWRPIGIVNSSSTDLRHLYEAIRGMNATQRPLRGGQTMDATKCINSGVANGTCAKYWRS